MLPPEIVGHKAQRFLLEKLFVKGRLPHALLFSGPPGIGKRQAAYELINSIFCENRQGGYLACRSCKGCQLLYSGNHPDLRELDCLDRSSVNAENMREILYSLNLNSFLSGNRVMFFDNAEFLPLQSANILLKTLEEPGRNTHFILVSANPSKLPQTILSRCQIINFNALTDDQLEEIIRNRSAEPEFKEQLSRITMNKQELSELIKFAQGSFANLLSIIDTLESWVELRDQCAQIFRGDIAAGAALAEKLSKDKENLRSNLRFISGIIRRLMQASRNHAEYEKAAVCLTNIILAEKLIFERNLSAAYVLNYVLLNLAAKGAVPGKLDESVSLLANA